MRGEWGAVCCAGEKSSSWVWCGVMGPTLQCGLRVHWLIKGL